ncbi:MAG: luciferase [Natronomonas sp.]
MLRPQTLDFVGVDAIAVKPTEHDLEAIGAAAPTAIETVVIDYEGREAFPDAATLSRLEERFETYVTTPVRATGFDPLGDDSLLETIPDGAKRALVAGNGAYLTDEERKRAVTPRLRAAANTAPGAWIGTEGIERIALAIGGPQFELLSRDTERAVRALRTAGFDDEIVLYAPTVVSGDEDVILDAIGGYVARRKPVRRALPDEAATDATASGRAREVLSAASRDYGLVGDDETVRQQAAGLREAGVDRIVAYPADGLDV